MSNVLIDRQKIDLLANAISAKSGEPLTLTLDEMVEAVDGIEAGSAEPVLQTKSVTPTETAQTVTADSGYDGLAEVDVGAISSTYVGSGIVRRDSEDIWVSTSTGIFQGESGYYSSNFSYPMATQSATAITPTESSQTAVKAGKYTTGAVTVNAIPSNYVGSGITQRSSSDLTASGATVTVPSGYYSAQATKSVTSGTAGTPTATKGAVSNHSVSVTPSVTNTTGYITGGTKNGTAVTVTASELVSGSETVTANDTYDVTNLAELVVNVSGGDTGTINVGTATRTLSSTASSIQFTGLSGNPTSFVVTSSADVATNTDGVTAVVYDGASLHGQTMTTQVEADTGFTKSYSGGTLTITATSASFQANAYKLVYTYGGSTSDIETADVQVGSGATSITFPVNGRPQYWSCIFKSDFSTSSGYQRVIAVANDGSSTYGLAMDSSAHASTAWTASYSGGNLTITSQGTNNGGYFHQPGYYQLTYTVDDSAPSYQSKTVRPTTSQQTVTADSGYDALDEVTVTAVSQTNLTAANIKSGTTVTISNGQSNLWSVTGTYSGDGGGSVNIDTKTATASNYPTSLSFTSMEGEPKAWSLRATSQISSSGSTTYYYIIDMHYNGTSTTGNVFRIGSTRQVNNITSGYSWSYSGTTLTITSSAASRSNSPGAFNNGYELVYIY